MAANFKNSHWVMAGPAAGITDRVTRQIAKAWGADATMTGLISSEGIVRGHARTLELLEFDDSERPIGIQLFGANPKVMAEAARRVESMKPDFIDLNFGCPAPKVIGKNGGSALLSDLKTLGDIVAAVCKAVSIPVTAKIRAGINAQNIVAVQAAKICEDNGAAAICIHPRTVAQKYSGDADWSIIARAKNAVNIPVIGSGDVDSPEKALAMFNETNCDALMVCRAAFGNPWIFGIIRKYLETGTIEEKPDLEMRIDAAINHLEKALDYYGVKKGIFVMRKHLAWYIKGLPGASEAKPKIMGLTDVESIVGVLRSLVKAGNRTAAPQAEWSRI